MDFYTVERQKTIMKEFNSETREKSDQMLSTEKEEQLQLSENAEREQAALEAKRKREDALFEVFENYCARGFSALERSEYEEARRNILAAAETILKLTEDSVGTEKARRLQKATELYAVANKIAQKQKIINPDGQD